jgi:hypothetical protein
MIQAAPTNALRRLFDSRYGAADRLIPRWLFLRALALIYFSAFYSLLFQIKGLIGPTGIMPAREFLAAVTEEMGLLRFWYAPSLYWINSSSAFLMAITWLGLIASMAALFNLWPRLTFFICFLCFLSFVTASSIFSSYQSDGMLLEAGFLALFFAPRGLRPGWGADHPPSRASLYLLQWEWFRIYFESGLVKLLSGDTQWRDFSAMNEYYQNGPLPTWIGWYAEHLPHWFHASSVAATLIIELVVVLMLFLPRRFRLICFLIVTPWELAVILTANYAFLNYLVLVLGILLLDDKYLLRIIPSRFHTSNSQNICTSLNAPPSPRFLRLRWESTNPSQPQPTTDLGAPGPSYVGTAETTPHPISASLQIKKRKRGLTHDLSAIPVAISAFFLLWVGYNTIVLMLRIPDVPIPTALLAPVAILDPLRVANQYGLFAVMTRGRYEIEFQGSNDGIDWTPYPFRNKPQALNEAPRIYAPYQPRFDWNLWFASLGSWEQNQFVPLVEERLLSNDASVLSLFRANPFAQSPPRYVRAVLWQYWFTSIDEKRKTGNWWRRQFLGIYAPVLTITPTGSYVEVQQPDPLPEHD